ncbi:MAG TPA: hypothetical protein VFT95_16965 [Micromonosporaceae bacterium]|nr:hypothetical protein [Micromonosporaceae bacterium]
MLMLVEDLVPTEYDVAAVVREEKSGYASAWSLTVYAVCAYRPPGWEIVSAAGANTERLGQPAAGGLPAGHGAARRRVRTVGAGRPGGAD